VGELSSVGNRPDMEKVTHLLRASLIRDFILLAVDPITPCLLSVVTMGALSVSEDIIRRPTAERYDRYRGGRVFRHWPLVEMGWVRGAEESASRPN